MDFRSCLRSDVRKMLMSLELGRHLDETHQLLEDVEGINLFSAPVFR